MKYLTNLFKGRINRRNLILGLVSSISVLFVSIILLSFFPKSNIDSLVGLTMIVVFTTVLIFNLSLQVRRCHDTGNSGFILLLDLLGIGIFILLYLFLKRGQEKENQYGRVPDKNIRFPQDILALN